MGASARTSRSRAAGAPITFLVALCAALLLLPAGGTARPAPRAVDSAAPCPSADPCTAASVLPPGEPSQWRLLPSGAHAPSARTGAAAAYDPGLSEVVLFGGSNAAGEPLGDTWGFSHGAWTPIPTGPLAPPPRWGASVAYDGASGRLLLFGGQNGSAQFSDTWLFNGSAWRPVVTPTAPAARSGAAIAYDPSFQGVVLFGGDAGSGRAANDTWLFSGATWVDLTNVVRGSPAPLDGPSLAYLPDTSTLVLVGSPVGGLSGAAPTAVWTLTGSIWAPAGASDGPAPVARMGAAFVADPVSGAVLFGGALPLPSGAAVYLSDTWTYGPAGWANTTDATSAVPPPRSGAAASFDPAGGGVLMFGGTGGSGVLGDTWSYGPVPIQLTVTASPTAGEAPLNVTFEVTVHGGVPPYASEWSLGDGSPFLAGANGSHTYTAQGTYLAELQVNDSVGGSATARVTLQVLSPWEAAHQWGELSLPASRAPTPRWSAQVAYDPSMGAAVLFGGEVAGGAAAGDTWVFANGVWINLTAGMAVAPPPRWGGSLAYDPGAGDLVLFGGFDGTRSYNDTWTYSPSVGWQETPTDTAPSPRVLSSLVADPGLSGDLLFGGGLRSAAGGWTIYNDTWEWKDGAWTNLTAPLIRGPPPTIGASISYDSAAGQVLMFGGSALPPGGTPGTCYPDSELWIFASDQWSLSTVADPPSQRLLSASAYLPSAGSTIVFGGAEARSGGCAAGGDTWSYDNATWSNLSAGIDVTPPARSAAAALYDASEGVFVLFGGDENGVPLNDTWVYPALLNESATTSVQQTTSTSTGSSNGSGGSGPGTTSGSGPATFTVGYTISGAGGRAPEPVSFSATETGGTPPFTVSWYFGDSTPDGAGANITHTYTVPGTFEAVLTVVDATGETVQELVGPIVIQPPLPGGAGPAALPPAGGGPGWLFPALGGAGVAVIVVAVLVELRQRRLREEGDALVREIEQSKNP